MVDLDLFDLDLFDLDLFSAPSILSIGSSSTGGGDDIMLSVTDLNESLSLSGSSVLVALLSVMY